MIPKIDTADAMSYGKHTVLFMINMYLANSLKTTAAVIIMALESLSANVQEIELILFFFTPNEIE